MKKFSKTGNIQEDLDALYEEVGKLYDRLSSSRQLEQRPGKNAVIRIGEFNGQVELRVKFNNEWYKVTGLEKVG